MVDFRKLLETQADENAALKNYVAQLPVYGVDPETGATNYTNPVVPKLRLPVQGIHDQPYIPTQADLNGPIQFMPSVQQGIANVKDIYQYGFDMPENISAKIFGPMEGGSSDVPERTQTWPEKMVRSGASLPTDVMAGKVLSGPGLRAIDYSDIPGAPEPLANLIERTQDLAGLAAGGSVAATGLKAEKPGLLARGASNLKERLHQLLAEDSEAGTGIGAIKNAGNEIIGTKVIGKIKERGDFNTEWTDLDHKLFKEKEKLIPALVNKETGELIKGKRGDAHGDITEQNNLNWKEYDFGYYHTGDKKFYTSAIDSTDLMTPSQRMRNYGTFSDDQAGTGIGAITISKDDILRKAIDLSKQQYGTGKFAKLNAKQKQSLMEDAEVELSGKTNVKYDADVYHGTNQNFIGEKIRSIIDDPNRDYFFTTNRPETASRYAETRSTQQYPIGENPQVLPLKINTKNYHEFDAQGKNWNDPSIKKAIDDAVYNTDKDGIVIKNVIDEPTFDPKHWNTNELRNNKGEIPTGNVYVTFPGMDHTIRGRFAKFDRKNYGKPGLMLEDDVVGTGVSSLADRLHEHLNERPNVSNEYKGETMPEILARQRASEGYEAAIRDPETKKLYTGIWHEEVLDKIAKDKGIPKDQLPTNLIKGYINDRGRFLTEEDVEKLSQNKSKSKTAMFRSDDIVGTGLTAMAPRFYSHMENVINDAKMMVRNAEGKRVEVPQEKFNANELNAYLKNKGVSNEEIEALKIPEFLEGKKSVTRQELLNHLNENKVELNEKWFGGSQRKSLKEYTEENPNLKNPYDEWMKYLKNDNSNPPRFAQYQLAGGSNYRELLLSTKNNPKNVKRVEEINNEISNVDKQINYINNNINHDQINTKNPEALSEIKKLNTESKGNSVLAQSARARQNELQEEIYKELKEKKYALAAERLDLEQSFTTDHWPGHKDIVVHGRMNDRFIPDESGPATREAFRYKNPETGEIEIKRLGNKGYNTLHAEEVQSDWLQQGNSEGFKLSAKDKAKLEPEFNRIEEKITNSGDEAVMSNPEIKNAVKLAVDKKIITEAEAKTYLRYADSERYGAVKDAPFKSTWSDLMIKRLIRQASEEGKDAISWTPGQAQIDRYPGLEHYYDRLEYNPETKIFKAYDKEGKQVNNQELDKNKLVSHIGKETTDKLINNPSRKEDFKVKENKNGMYEVVNQDDKVFFKAINKYDALDYLDKQGTHILDNADLKVGGEFHKKFYDEIMVNKVNAIAKKYGGRVVEKEINDNHHGWHKIWLLILPPELKKAALEKGFSLFETGLPLTPVDHDPFNDQKKKHRLVPVQGNPFSPRNM